MSQLLETFQQLLEYAVSTMPDSPSDEHSALIIRAVRQLNLLADVSYTAAAKVSDLNGNIRDAFEDRDTLVDILSDPRDRRFLIRDIKALMQAAGAMAVVLDPR